MSIRRLNPYIHFNGTTQEAITLYESALGAKTEHIMHYGEGGCMTVPPEHNGLIMHSVLRIGEGMVMMSDTPPGRPVSTEGNVELALDFAELPAMQKAFDALATSGKVCLPIQDMFWGAKFGILTDAYGVRWLFNCELKKPDGQGAAQ